jgi:hypothetical protein
LRQLHFKHHAATDRRDRASRAGGRRDNLAAATTAMSRHATRKLRLALPGSPGLAHDSAESPRPSHGCGCRPPRRDNAYTLGAPWTAVLTISRNRRARSPPKSPRSHNHVASGLLLKLVYSP